jgi:hypothetical protein
MTTAPHSHRLPNRSPFDRFIYALVTLGWNKADIAAYPDHLRLYDSVLTDQNRISFEQVDAKATGLLTHVSLMIAGLGLVAPLVVDNDVELGVVIAEISVYLLIAIGCLRCLSLFHAQQFNDDEASLRATFERELIIRRELYSLCIRVSIAFTLLVFLLLPVLFLWKPERHL